jgi:hypothetical protein
MELIASEDVSDWAEDGGGRAGGTGENGEVLAKALHGCVIEPRGSAERGYVLLKFGRRAVFFRVAAPAASPYIAP